MQREIAGFNVHYYRHPVKAITSPRCEETQKWRHPLHRVTSHPLQRQPCCVAILFLTLHFNHCVKHKQSLFHSKKSSALKLWRRHSKICKPFVFKRRKLLFFSPLEIYHLGARSCIHCFLNKLQNCIGSCLRQTFIIHQVKLQNAETNTISNTLCSDQNKTFITKATFLCAYNFHISYECSRIRLKHTHNKIVSLTYSRNKLGKMTSHQGFITRFCTRKLIHSYSIISFRLE